MSGAPGDAACPVAVALPDRVGAGDRRVNRPLRGILLAVAAIAFFSCSDATAKYLSETLPAIEIAWMRYVTFTFLMLVPVMRGGAATLRTSRPGLQIMRGLAVLFSALLFTMSVRYLPLAEATTMNFVSPMFITALSIPILGEKVGVRRWAAVASGLVGVLIVVRPGSDAFQAAAAYPILSAATWAAGMIITRRMAGADGTVTTLAWSAFTGVAAASLMLPFDMVVPSPTEVALCLFIGIVSTIGQWLVVMAYNNADASVIAPFSYSQLIWATLLGYALFGALPDAGTYVGAGVIVASGLYTAHRERARARHRTVQGS